MNNVLRKYKKDLILCKIQYIIGVGIRGKSNLYEEVFENLWKEKLIILFLIYII